MNPLPDGGDSVRGDSGALRDRGTRTGVTDTYGADLGQDATNRASSIAKGTKSDSPFESDVDGMKKDGDE
jgi:hypothetical protein